jgi:hypothetical protein
MDDGKIKMNDGKTSRLGKEEWRMGILVHAA